MKKYFLFSLIILISGLSTTAQVGISATNTPPNASAMLDVSSTNKGVLIPRMNTAQKNAIPNKAEGLMVYDSDAKQFSYWTGTLWVNFGNSVSAGPGWSQTGADITNTNSGIVKINSATYPATNAIFGSNGNGISLQKDFPTIGFNQYRDASNQQRYIGNGYAMGLFVAPSSGTMIWNSNPSGFAGGLTSSETSLMALSTDGKLGIGVLTPEEKLTVSTLLNSYGILHTGSGISVGSFVSSVGGAFGTKTNHPFSLFANNSNAALTVKTNAEIEIANGMYSPSLGGLNMIPIGVISVSYRIDTDINLQNLVITNKAGNLALGTYDYINGDSSDDFSLLSVKLNLSLLTGYTSVVLIGTPNFDHFLHPYISGSSARYRFTSPNAFLDIQLASDDFVNCFVSGDYIIYGIK
jgi:hypothetical protein